MDEILKFFNENKDALTAIGIILTFFVSIISLYFSVRNNKAVHYVDSVTKNRVEWINNLRKCVSKFVRLSNTRDLTINCLTPTEMLEKDVDSKIGELEQVGVEIKLLLNFSDDYDRKIINCLDLQIVTFKRICIQTLSCAMWCVKNNDEIYVPDDKICKLEEEIENLSEKIIRYFQIYLKSEWNRVKYESRGKTYEKETQKFDLEELEEKYKNPDYRKNGWKRYCINSKAKMRRIWKSSGFTVFLVCVGIAVLALVIPSTIKDIMAYIH